MRHRTFASALCLALASLSGASAQGGDVHQETAVDRAFEHMEAERAAEQRSKAQGKRDAGQVRGAMSFGGTPEARKVFDRVMRNAGSDGARLSSLAYWMAPSGQLDLGEYAIEAYQAALRADSSQALTWQNYASVLAQMGKYAEAAQAIHLANRGVAVDPGNRRWSLNVYLGRALAEAGMEDVARILMQDIPNPGQLSVVDKPLYETFMATPPPGKIDLGFVAADRGGKVMVTDVTRGGLAESWGMQVGDQLRKLGHTRLRTRKDMIEALREATGDLRFMIRRGARFVFVTGDPREKEEEGAESKALSDEGVARFRAGNLAGATVKLDQAVKEDPRNADAWFNLGLVRRAAQDPIGAATGFAASLAIGLDPATTPKVQRALAAISAGTGEPLPALVSEEVSVLTESGNQYLRRNEHVQALLDYMRALRKAPGAPLALFGAFSVAETMELSALAVRLGEAYLRVFPDAPNRTKTLARLHRLKTGMTTSAALTAGS